MANSGNGKDKTSRDLLRTKILGAKIRRQTVDLGDGTMIEVREPTVGQLLDAVGTEDMQHRMAKMLIACCFDPESGQAIFEEADFDTLMSLPSSGAYNKLTSIVTSFMSVDEQVKAEGKGSGEAQPSSS